MKRSLIRTSVNQKTGDRPEWRLLKQFHKYMKYNWPRKHTEKHGKNKLSDRKRFRVLPCISVAGFLSKCHSGQTTVLIKEVGANLPH